MCCHYGMLPTGALALHAQKRITPAPSEPPQGRVGDAQAGIRPSHH